MRRVFFLSFCLVPLFLLTCKGFSTRSSGSENSGFSGEEVTDWDREGRANRKELAEKERRKSENSGSDGDVSAVIENETNRTNKTDQAPKRRPDPGLDHSSNRPPAEPRRELPAGPSGLKAGYSDDNRQFNYYLSFLEKYGKAARHIPVNVQERIVLRVKDSAGKTLPNAELTFYNASGRKLEAGRTNADGAYNFYPSFFGGDKTYSVKIERDGRSQRLVFQRQGPRQLDFTWRQPRKLPAAVPLDILFVMDTTGSMGEEIAQLKRSIAIIYKNLASVRPRPRIRFGMVLYRDREDDYVTKVVPLTADLNKFKATLDEVIVGGGGDNPEDLQQALDDSLHKIKWAPNGVRLGFVVTDAPPHLYPQQKFHYVKSALEARKRGIKFYTIGTGGLNLDGEYVLRQIAQLTRGRYIFLTYGNETGDNEGGRPGSVSHHTGSNFNTDKLEAIVIRFAREELSHLTRISVSPLEEYWGARPVKFESSQETLQKLFGEAAAQLVSYSSFRINEKGGAPTAVLPILAGLPADDATARYFSEQLTMAVSRNKAFKLVERERVKAVLAELARQRSGLYDEEHAAKIGRLSGAKFLVTGKLVRRPGGTRTAGYSLFLKMVRVETAEVLSVAEARIDGELGRQQQAHGTPGAPAVLARVSNRSAR